MFSLPAYGQLSPVFCPPACHQGLSTLPSQAGALTRHLTPPSPHPYAPIQPGPSPFCFVTVFLSSGAFPPSAFLHAVFLPILEVFRGYGIHCTTLSAFWRI